MATDTNSAPLTTLAQAIIREAGNGNAAPPAMLGGDSAIRPAGDARRRGTSAMPRHANCTK